MSSPNHPYAKSPLSKVDTEEDDNVSMQDNSPSLKDLDVEDSKQAMGEENKDKESSNNCNNWVAKEEINFEENHFQIPPLFNQPINKETLCDDDCPYVFWALLWLPIPKDPVNPMAAVFDALKDFIMKLANEDPNFVVFPHNVSKYESVEDLPPPIETLDDLPRDIDEWLLYFPQAKPRISSGDMYNVLLIGLSILLPKLVKNLSVWMRNKRYGLWKAYLQSEWPMSLGWLLFSTQSMDVKLLKDAILDLIENIPVGLCWKMISHTRHDPKRTTSQGSPCAGQCIGCTYGQNCSSQHSIPTTLWQITDSHSTFACV